VAQRNTCDLGGIEEALVLVVTGAQLWSSRGRNLIRAREAASEQLVTGWKRS
jgi:hypothetical protein